MSNTNLKIEDLGDEVGLSRVQLYRKVKALTGMTPVEILLVNNVVADPARPGIRS